MQPARTTPISASIALPRPQAPTPREPANGLGVPVAGVCDPAYGADV